MEEHILQDGERENLKDKFLELTLHLIELEQGKYDIDYDNIAEIRKNVELLFNL